MRVTLRALPVAGASDGEPARFWRYFPSRDAWEPFELAVSGDWSALGLGITDGNLHAVGGRRDGQAAADHRIYQAIYTIEIPIVQ